MLDLLGRWSSEHGEEDLIDAVVVESTVGEAMVGAVIVGGFLVVVRLARINGNGTTAAGTPGSTGRAESELLAFDMGKVVAKVTTVESTASAVAKAVETRLMLCFALLAASVISGRKSFNSHVETTAVVLGDMEGEWKGVADMVAAISAVAKLLDPVPLGIKLWSDSIVISAGRNRLS